MRLALVFHDILLGCSIIIAAWYFTNRWPAFTSYISFELFREKDAVLHNQSFLWQTVLSKLNRSSADSYCTPISLAILAAGVGRSCVPTADVRMRYQNKDISLPICAEDGKHLSGYPQFCTLAAFRDRVRELTPVDWEAECTVEGKST